MTTRPYHRLHDFLVLARNSSFSYKGTSPDGGRIVKTASDRLLLEFASVVDAVLRI